jgi:hypothetical protein
MNIFSFEIVASLVSLTLLEVVLGVDNVVFLAILSQRSARRAGEQGAPAWPSHGLGHAAWPAVHALSWLAGLVAPLFTLAGRAFSGRDLVLLAGGLFLVGKATFEIQAKLESGTPIICRVRPPRADPGLDRGPDRVRRRGAVHRFGHHRGRHGAAAVGHGRGHGLAMAMMIVAADQTTAFIQRHPSMKILGPGVPHFDRRDVGRRCHGPPPAARLRLLRHGLLAGSRVHQHSRPHSIAARAGSSRSA